MSKARQEKHSEEVRTRILEIARRIIAEEGVDALSIRRITKEMDYSVGIIYHYFQNKDEILTTLMQENFQRIMKSVRREGQDQPPDEAMRTGIRSYMETVLQWPKEYKMIMLNTSPQILAFTSILSAKETSPALQAMISILERGIEMGMFTPCDTKLAARAIWSSMFGLVIRLIIEGNVPPDQQSALVTCQIDFIMKRLKA
jgi:AcrR family transcriptional regulator